MNPWKQVRDLWPVVVRALASRRHAVQALAGHHVKNVGDSDLAEASELHGTRADDPKVADLAFGGALSARADADSDSYRGLDVEDVLLLEGPSALAPEVDDPEFVEGVAEQVPDTAHRSPVQVGRRGDEGDDSRAGRQRSGLPNGPAPEVDVVVVDVLQMTAEPGSLHWLGYSIEQRSWWPQPGLRGGSPEGTLMVKQRCDTGCAVTDDPAFASAGVPDGTLLAVIRWVAEHDREPLVRLQFKGDLAFLGHGVGHGAQLTLAGGVVERVRELYLRRSPAGLRVVEFQGDLEVGDRVGGEHQLEGVHGRQHDIAGVVGPTLRRPRLFEGSASLTQPLD